MMQINIPSKDKFLQEIIKYKNHEPRDAMYKVATDLVKRSWGKPADMANGLGVLLLTWNNAFYRYGIFNFDELEKCIGNNFPKIKGFRERDISKLSSSEEEDIKYLFDQFLEALQIDTMRFSDSNTKKYTLDDLKKLLGKWNIEYNDGNLETIYESIKYNPKIKDAIKFTNIEGKVSKKRYINVTVSKLAGSERASLKSTKLIMKSPVAVAKALHLLAPNFFPLWDDRIARKYGCYYKKNPAEKYFLFCKITRDIADKVTNYDNLPEKPLIKLIDEYNYSKYTKE